MYNNEAPPGGTSAGKKWYFSAQIWTTNIHAAFRTDENTSLLQPANAQEMKSWLKPLSAAIPTVGATHSP